MKFHLSTPVWGGSFIEFFLNFALPNFLSAGNLETLAREHECVYEIYTTTKNAETIGENAVFQRLTDLCEARIIPVDGLLASSDFAKVYPMMKKCNEMAISSAEAEEAVMVLLSPDALFSDGTFARLGKLAMEGARVVMLPECRIRKDPFLADYAPALAAMPDRTALPSRDLVRIALKHLHPITKSYFVDAKHFNSAPYKIYWRVGDEGMLGHCLILHPIMIHPERSVKNIYQTIDSDYITRACPSVNSYHIVDDSDEMVGFEFSGESDSFLEDRNVPLHERQRFTPYLFATFVAANQHTVSKAILRKAVKIHSGDLNSKWERAERQSKKTIRLCRQISLIARKSLAHPNLLALNRVTRVVIFGAGAGGEKALHRAEALGWSVAGFTDNDETRWGTTCFGKPVRPPVDLYARDYDLIMIASPGGRIAITKQLKKMGFAPYVQFVHAEEPLYFLDRKRADGEQA